MSTNNTNQIFNQLSQDQTHYRKKFLVSNLLIFSETKNSNSNFPKNIFDCHYDSYLFFILMKANVLRNNNLDYNLSRCPNPRALPRLNNQPAHPPRPSSSTLEFSLLRGRGRRPVPQNRLLTEAHLRIRGKVPRSDRPSSISLTLLDKIYIREILLRL